MVGMKGKILFFVCVLTLLCTLLAAFAACTDKEKKGNFGNPAQTQRLADESPSDSSPAPEPTPLPAPPLRPQPRPHHAPMPGKKPRPHAPLHPAPDGENSQSDGRENDAQDEKTNG